VKQSSTGKVLFQLPGAGYVELKRNFKQGGKVVLRMESRHGDNELEPGAEDIIDDKTVGERRQSESTSTEDSFIP
jgi:hypothetical protein